MNYQDFIGLNRRYMSRVQVPLRPPSYVQRPRNCPGALFVCAKGLHAGQNGRPRALLQLLRHDGKSGGDQKRGRMCTRRKRKRARQFRDQALCAAAMHNEPESTSKTAHSTAFSAISGFLRRWAGAVCTHRRMVRASPSAQLPAHPPPARIGLSPTYYTPLCQGNRGILTLWIAR